MSRGNRRNTLERNEKSLVHGVGCGQGIESSIASKRKDHLNDDPVAASPTQFHLTVGCDTNVFLTLSLQIASPTILSCHPVCCVPAYCKLILWNRSLGGAVTRADHAGAFCAGAFCHQNLARTNEIRSHYFLFDSTANCE